MGEKGVSVLQLDSVSMYACNNSATAIRCKIASVSLLLCLCTEEASIYACSNSAVVTRRIMLSTRFRSWRLSFPYSRFLPWHYIRAIESAVHVRWNELRTTRSKQTGCAYRQLLLRKEVIVAFMFYFPPREASTRPLGLEKRYPVGWCPGNYIGLPCRSMQYGMVKSSSRANHIPSGWRTAATSSAS